MLPDDRATSSGTGSGRPNRQSTAQAPPGYTAARPRDPRRLRRSLLIVGLTLPFGWWGYPLLWWVPVFLFTFLADNLRTFVEHSHTESDAEADAAPARHQRPGWIERQLLGADAHELPRRPPPVAVDPLLQPPAGRRRAAPQRRAPTRSPGAGSLPRLPAGATPGRSRSRGAAPRRRVASPCRRWPPPSRPRSPLRRARSSPRPPCRRCEVCGGTDATGVAAGYDYELHHLPQPLAVRGVRRLRARLAQPAAGVEAPRRHLPVHLLRVQLRADLRRSPGRARSSSTRLKMRKILALGGRTPAPLPRRRLRRRALPRGPGPAGRAASGLFGLELDEHVVEKLQRARAAGVLRAGRDVRPASTPGTFDLITMFHVIEHVDSPREVVEQLASWLAPGGVLAMETPNTRQPRRPPVRTRHVGRLPHPPPLAPVPTGHARAGCSSRSASRSRRSRYETGHAFWMYSLPPHAAVPPPAPAAPRPPVRPAGVGRARSPRSPRSTGCGRRSAPRRRRC